MDEAPYEVLSNHVLSFDDVTKIKQVEDILEKYWNKQFFNHTVPYITDHVFPTPFDFFQEFGIYWHKKGWNKIGHQFTDLFKRLHQFLKEKSVSSLDIIEGLMYIDFYRNFKQKPHKLWNHSITLDEKQTIYDKLWEIYPFASYGFQKRDMRKHVLVHHTTFDVQTYLGKGEIITKPGWMLVIYHLKKDEPIFDFVCSSDEVR